MTYEYERVAAPAGALRLHLNENTAGCSPRVLAAIHALTREDAAFYPDYNDTVAAAARRLGVAPDRMVLTNGLDDGILATAVAAFRDRSDGGDYEAIVVVPAFDMYAACIDAAGGRVVEVPLGDGFAFPLESLLQRINGRTRAIFLTTPNNPTGGTIAPEQILRIASATQALVFVDEAYADFSGATLIGDQRFADCRNVLIGRTFAKAYGLAGLRAGAVVGHPDGIARVKRTIPPYTLNVCAAAALRAAFEDVEYYEWYLEQVRSSRSLLCTALDRHGVRYWPSAANFVLADFGPRLAGILSGLAARGIMIRDRSADPGCAGCARMTTGVVEHTARLVAALEEVLCGKP
jgi:histidinol-phosphate aminotransferase